MEKEENVHGRQTHSRNFYKMFDIPGALFKQEALDALTAEQTAKFVIDNGSMPAGFTYFGQFVDHDITKLKRSADPPGREPARPDELVQERTPSLDLDSVYGDGLGDSPNVLYTEHGEFDSPFKSQSTVYRKLTDLPRRLNDLHPYIADTRNDENFFVARLHLLFLNAHNRVMKVLGVDRTNFEKARKAVTLMYQRIITEDFLPRVLHPVALGALKKDPPVAPWLNTIRASQCRVPLEFAGAAFRFGHSLVRSNYELTDDRNASLRDLFLFTHRGGQRDIHTIPLNWDRLFEIPLKDSPVSAASITTRLAPAMGELINEQVGNRNLTRRNLLRGYELALPDGQACISHIKQRRPDYAAHYALDALTPVQLRTHPIGKVLEEWGMDRRTPLWTYVLMEPMFNDQPHAHLKLGKLGSLIVAEVFRSLLTTSSTSKYHDDKDLGDPVGDISTMAELIQFTQT